MSIYVLKLQQGKFYIGKSEDVTKRYQDHVNGMGPLWTQKYKPTSLFKTIRSKSSFDEDNITKEYMNLYGISNVRGGSYSSEVLPDYQVKTLRTELMTANDLCFRCGRPGHLSSQCYAKTHQKHEILSTVGECFRCGRTSHFSGNCYAKRHVKTGKCLSQTDSYCYSDSDSSYIEEYY